MDTVSFRTAAVYCGTCTCCGMTAPLWRSVLFCTQQAVTLSSSWLGGKAEEQIPAGDVTHTDNPRMPDCSVGSTRRRPSSGQRLKIETAPARKM
ncbi:Hypothetical predicted protein [Scomber scombrus]|uniref:Secreted protein n=1 Tax=Scomber scombrus TaxID=13677 RepID=A0AAV1NGN0_SCOSC